MTAWLTLGVALTACGARSRHYGDDISADSDSDVDVDVDVDVDADGDDAGPTYDAGTDPGRECVPRAENTPPYPVQILYPTIDACVRVANPTLKVANSSDPDGDVLRYHFEIDMDAGFRSIDLQESGSLPEGPAGFTEWRLPRPLVDGQTYYWRAWVDDCYEESEKVVAVFMTCIVD
jgi:hypothetical protein